MRVVSTNAGDFDTVETVREFRQNPSGNYDGLRDFVHCHSNRISNGDGNVAVMELFRQYVVWDGTWVRSDCYMTTNPPRFGFCPEIREGPQGNGDNIYCPGNSDCCSSESRGKNCCIRRSDKRRFCDSWNRDESTQHWCWCEN